jgi:hypothetical protein
MTYEDLLKLGRSELHELLVAGKPVDVDGLADREYHGTSLGLPGFVDKIAWKKFKKVFHREPDGSVRGWNVAAVQNALDEPWSDALKRGERSTYGYYAVRDAADYPVPARYRRGLMIDYGLGGNGRLDPMGRIRDPLVALDDAGTLLLGVSLLDSGPGGCWLLPTYFSLTPGAPLTYEVAPPRP